MKTYQIVLAFLLSGVAIFSEFKSIKNTSLFDFFETAPFVLLCLLTLLLLILNTRQYIQAKQMKSFIPSLICLCSLLIISWKMIETKRSDEAASLFTAATYQIGSDGGLIFDFKTNGYLKAERRDHWSVTSYRGKYSLRQDTVFLDIQLDFQLGRQAILTDSSLHIINDSINFQVDRQ
jgi:hypothetical protein